MIGPAATGVRRRVVVIGAGGRLGGALVPVYQDNFDVVAFDRAQLDLGDLRRVRAVLEPLDFDYLILAAALTAVDYCEGHEREAYLVNAEAPGVIARLCASKGAHMTCFSTDFVFDGAADAAYTEVDVPNPLSVYGASKLEGERQVLAASPRHLVVRLAWLFGCRRPAFPEWIIQQACQHATLVLPADKVGNPSCCEDLVAYLQSVLCYDVGRPCAGLLHLGNAGACTWQEWGQRCLDHAARHGVALRTTVVGAGRLAEVAAFAARRPPSSVLDTSKFTEMTGIQPRRWHEALDEHLARTLHARPAAQPAAQPAG